MNFIFSFITVAWVIEHVWLVLGILAALILLFALLRRRQKMLRAAYLAMPVLYIGNKSTHTFHRPTCAKLSSLAPVNAVHFRTVQEIHRFGYTPCNICKP